MDTRPPEAEAVISVAKRRQRCRRLKWIAVAAVVLVAAISVFKATDRAVSSSNTGVRTHPKAISSAFPPSCLDNQLELSLINTGDAADSVAWVGTLVNQSSHPRVLKGYQRFQMLGADRVPIPTTVSDETARVFGARPGTVPEMIDLGHGEAASFTVTVSDGAQSLPSLPACAAAVSVVVTPPGASSGIESAAPAWLIAYPYDKGGTCGFVSLGALLAGSAQRANCPGCYPPPPPGEVGDLKHG